MLDINKFKTKEKGLDQEAIRIAVTMMILVPLLLEYLDHLKDSALYRHQMKKAADIMVKELEQYHPILSDLNKANHEQMYLAMEGIRKLVKGLAKLIDQDYMAIALQERIEIVYGENYGVYKVVPAEKEETT